MFGYVQLSLKDVCSFKYGKGNKIPDDGGKYPVYGCNGIVGYTSTYNNENTPIVGHIGSAGVVVWGEGKHFVTYNGTICTPDENIILSRYLYHLLSVLNLSDKVKGNQPFLSIGDFDNIKVVIPSILEQEKILSKLEKFDKLCNDLTSGIPAEIEVIQKAYGYHRNKLLTFN